MQHLICKKAGGGGGVHLHFWGRRLVIYKIKSIKDLRLVIINGTRHPRQEHRRSDGRMRGIECCRTTRVAKVIVLSSFDFFFSKPRVDYKSQVVTSIREAAVFKWSFKLVLLMT